MYRTLSVALALIVGIGLHRPGLAQEAHGNATPLLLSLEELLQDVHTSNPTLRAARLRAEALTHRREQVTALPDPSIMAGYRPFGLDAVSDAVPNLSIQQSLPFPGKLELRGEAADYEAEATAYLAEALAEDLAFEVKQAFFQLYHLQQHDAHVRHFQMSLEDFEEAAAIKYEVGRGSQQAVLKAQLEKNALTRERLRLADRRRAAIERLARLTNRPELVRHIGAIEVVAPVVLVDSVRAIEVALSERPDMAALGAEIKRADTQVEMAKREYMPDFMLQAGFMDMGGMNGLAGLGNRFMIGGGITIPLQTGRRKAALEEAKVWRDEARARQEALQTEIRTRVNELRSRLREDAKALALYDATLVPHAETTLEAALSAYTTGQVDFLDLLDAERMRFELHVERERTYLSYLQATAELERTIGVDALSDPLLTRTSR